MRSPLIALAAATVLAAPLAAAAGAPASAACTAPEPVRTSATPATVVLGTSTPKGLELEVDVREHGCAVGVDTDANWETLRYAGYTGRDVTLQFQRTGGSWTSVGTATSGKGGTVSTTVTAGRDGCYRFVFGGSSTTAKVTSGADCVDVR